MLLYDEISYSFPSLRYSMEHMGGYCFFNDALAVMINNSKHNMPYAGLTSVSDLTTNRYWFLSDQQLRDLVLMTGSRHLLFGLDFPYNQI